MMVVVQEQDINHAISAAVELGVMVIHLVSTGGFLGNRSGTLLIGVPEDLEQNLIDALQKACKQRLEYINMPVEGNVKKLV